MATPERLVALVEELRGDMRDRWQRGECPLAESYLETHPELATCEDALLDFLYAEFCIREAQGAVPKPDEYLARFPQWHQQLSELFVMHAALAGERSPFDELTPQATIDEPLVPDTVAVGSSAKGSGVTDTGRDTKTADDPYATQPVPSTVSRLAASNPPRTISQSQQFADYELLDIIGRGGMGVVYRARQLRLNRIVALKMIRSGDLASPEELARFLGEAETAASLQHPNIVTIYEYGEHDGRCFFSMDYIVGQSLADVVRDRPLAEVQAARHVKCIAEAIAYAHAQGILHRDLKPANVLIDAAGAVHVTDFGLAKRMTADSSATATGQVLGTPSYMPPEQAQGMQDRIGPHSDVYSLGATLYALLTGRPPFQAASPVETLTLVIDREPVGPRRLNATVSPDLDTICLKCLAKEPSRRYESAQALADDLGRFLEGQPILARPVSRVERLRKWARRRPSQAALVAVSTAAALILLIGSLVYNARLNVALDETRTERDKAKTAQKAAEVAQTRAERGEALAQKRYEEVRRSLNASQLQQAATMSHSDPGLALAMLDDVSRCPADLRDFTWKWLRQSCLRDRVAFDGHSGGVRAVAVHPGGKLWATSDSTGTVRLWSANGPGGHKHESVELSGHSSAVNSLAFSPDGERLASGSEDKSIRLWDVDKRQLAAVLEGHGDNVNCVTFSPDSQRLASASSDATIRLWNHTGEFEATLEGHVDSIFSVAFSPDGEQLASGGKDMLVRLWSVADRRELHAFDGHRGFVTGVTFALDGQTLATGSIDRTVRMWDVASRKTKAVVAGHTGAVSSLAFSPDGDSLASASYDKTLRLWDLANGREQTVLRGHQQAVLGVAWTATGDRLFSGSLDGTARLWDRTARQETLISAHTRPITSLALSPDARTIATAGYDQQIKLWDAATLELRQTLPMHDHWFSCLTFDDNGQHLVSADGDGHVQMWPMNGAGQQIDFKAHDLWITSLATMPHNQYVVTIGSDDPHVRLWDLIHQQQDHPINVPGQQPIVAMFSRKAQWLAVGDIDGTVRLCSGQYWGEQRASQVSQQSVRCLAFLSDGKSLVAGASDGTAAIWHPFENAPLVELRGHTGAVLCLAVSPDGQAIASGGSDRSIRLWDPVTGQQRGTFNSHTGDVSALAFSRDSSTLISTGADGTLRAWVVGVK